MKGRLGPAIVDGQMVKELDLLFTIHSILLVCLTYRVTIQYWI